MEGESVTREEIIEGLEQFITDFKPFCGNKSDWQRVDDALALLKAQAPDEDWISRKRLRDEIQYYIEEAGWGDEGNKVLGWCLEFIDNQRAVTWNDA